MQELSVNLDARTAKIFSYLWEKAPKIKNRAEAKSKTSDISLSRVCMDNNQIVGGTKIGSIMSDLEVNGIVYRGESGIYILDCAKTHHLYHMLRKKELI